MFQSLSQGLNPYFTILLILGFGAALGLGMSALSLFLGPHKPNAHKLEPYECGLPVFSTAEHRFSIKFYLVAILFILFDIETIFLYLWSLMFQTLGWFGVVEVGLFLVTLLVGYIYAIKRNALDLEPLRKRQEIPKV